jgi:hypothetical protein
MSPHPFMLLEMARLRQEELLAEAQHERLVNSIRKSPGPSLITRCVTAARRVAAQLPPKRPLFGPTEASTHARPRWPSAPGAPA